MFPKRRIPKGEGKEKTKNTIHEKLNNAKSVWRKTSIVFIKLSPSFYSHGFTTNEHKKKCNKKYVRYQCLRKGQEYKRKTKEQDC